jgi:hypothetical protein
LHNVRLANERSVRIQRGIHVPGPDLDAPYVRYSIRPRPYSIRPRPLRSDACMAQSHAGPERQQRVNIPLTEASGFGSAPKAGSGRRPTDANCRLGRARQSPRTIFPGHPGRSLPPAHPTLRYPPLLAVWYRASMRPPPTWALLRPEAGSCIPVADSTCVTATRPPMAHRSPRCSGLQENGRYLCTQIKT